jgi:hypothetical protein
MDLKSGLIEPFFGLLICGENNGIK